MDLSLTSSCHGACCFIPKSLICHVTAKRTPNIRQILIHLVGPRTTFIGRHSINLIAHIQFDRKWDIIYSEIIVNFWTYMNLKFSFLLGFFPSIKFSSRVKPYISYKFCEVRPYYRRTKYEDYALLKR
jgi:hypothetical protein